MHTSGLCCCWQTLFFHWIQWHVIWGILKTWIKGDALKSGIQRQWDELPSNAEGVAQFTAIIQNVFHLQDVPIVESAPTYSERENEPTHGSSCSSTTNKRRQFPRWCWRSYPIQDGAEGPIQAYPIGQSGHWSRHTCSHKRKTWGDDYAQPGDLNMVEDPIHHIQIWLHYLQTWVLE